MATQVQFRRGTTTETNLFTGAVGEVTVDTTKNVCVVHDGATSGGFPMLRQDGTNSLLSSGSLSTPSLKFSSSTTTGIYSPSPGSISIVNNGIANLTIDSSGAVSVPGNFLLSGSLSLPQGTANSPALKIGVGTQGLYSPGTDLLGFSVGGAQRASMSATTFVWGATTGDCGIEIGNGATANRAAYLDLVGDTTYTDYGLRLIRNNSGANAGSSLIHRGTGGLVLVTQEAGPIAFNTTGLERARITADGNLALGNVGAAGYSFLNTKTLTGATTTYGQVNQGVVQSDCTTSAVYFSTNALTQAAAFTLPVLTHFQALQGTFGAGSAVTDQYGFRVHAGLIGATNNYGFYGNIPSGTGRWNFYAAGTADSYFASNNFIFANGGTEKARVDSSGRLLVGTSTASGLASGVVPYFQIHGTTNSASTIAACRWSANVNQSFLLLSKSRGATVGTQAAVIADDTIGTALFTADDGTSFVEAARISALVDGTPGLNSMPGRIVFSTTANGAATATEQWRINNAGTVIYNQPAPAAINTTATLTVANLTSKIITSTTAAAVTMTLPLGTDMDTGFSGTYTNMAFEWAVINTGATNAVTIQANTGHTIVGSATVAASNSGRFLCRRTAANTWVTYRLSS